MAEHSLLGRPTTDRALGGVAALLDRLPRHRPTLAVLTYHRVAPTGSRSDLHPGLCVDPRAFADQVHAVARTARPVSLDQVLTAATGGTELPARAVLVTFDDAYAEVEEHAWPILRDAGIPATMFVPTSFPDRARSFWWDRLSHSVQAAPTDHLTVAGRAWPTGDATARATTFAALRARVAALPHDDAMTLIDDTVDAAAAVGVAPCRPATSSWDDLRRMAGEGLALAPHTRHHPFLDRVDGDRLDDELVGSLADLRTAVGSAARPALAYPSGAFDDTVVAATARAGYAVAFTTDRGVADLRAADWLRIPRINVGRRAPAGLVRIQLNPGPHTARTLARSVLDRTRPGRRPTNGRNPWS